MKLNIDSCFKKMHVAWRPRDSFDERGLEGLGLDYFTASDGARSHLYGAETVDHLVEALPNASAVSFERSGHAPHLEEPERFNRILAQFAADLPPFSETERQDDQEKTDGSQIA